MPYSDDTFDEIVSIVSAEYNDAVRITNSKSRNKVTEAVLALALCHNVTPVYENENGEEAAESDIPESDQNAKVTYQASSPNEVALEERSGSVGLKLAARALSELTQKAPQGTTLG